MRLLVDGVFFQFASSGIARVWSSLLPRVAARGTIEIFVLDRGGLPPIAGVTLIPFPAYRDRYTADDSILLQKMCDFYRIDVFTSTYYSSPLTTPMLLLVYDMIPELLEFDLSQRFWMEKAVTISFARRFIAISRSTRRDLLHFYPEIPESAVAVAYPGVDEAIFRPQDPAEVRRFRAAIGFERPYFLQVGAREQHKGYKNTRLFYEAYSEKNYSDVDVLCVGGEPEIEPASLALMPEGARISRVTLKDTDLALAYAGAAALIYPSLYEGFGLPLVEAMACECPVITTKNGSLAEIAEGDACLTIDGASVEAMKNALDAVLQPDIRAKLVAAGNERVQVFKWDGMVECFESNLIGLAKDANAGVFDDFFVRWSTLRGMQADVDLAKIF